jgi:hypothetical protein
LEITPPGQDASPSQVKWSPATPTTR